MTTPNSNLPQPPNRPQQGSEQPNDGVPTAQTGPLDGPAPGQPRAVRVQYQIKLSPPTLTRTLIVINALVFVAMVVYGFVQYGTLRGTEDMNVLIFFGAKVNEYIAQGQVWRLFTAMFIHIGVIHLLVNLYALYALGPLVEGYFGHLRFLAIYLLGGLFGSLGSYTFSNAVSAGASGAIFALAGAITIFFLKYRENFGSRGRSILQNMFFIIGLNLVFGMTMPGIDNWGHIGGLIGGAVVAFGLLPRYNFPTVYTPGVSQIEQEERAVQNLLWLTLCVALLYFGVVFVTRTIHGG